MFPPLARNLISPTMIEFIPLLKLKNPATTTCLPATLVFHYAMWFNLYVVTVRMSNTWFHSYQHQTEHLLKINAQDLLQFAHETQDSFCGLFRRMESTEDETLLFQRSFGRLVTFTQLFLIIVEGIAGLIFFHPVTMLKMLPGLFL